MTTFTKVLKKSGSTQRYVEVSRNGEPFGMLWTWPTTKYEEHPWHYKSLTDIHGFFYGKDGLKHVKKAISEL